MEGTGEAIAALVRPTARGKLYTFVSTEAAGPMKVKLPQGSLTLGLDRYSVVEASSAGITLIEAAGDVAIDGKTVFRIQNGRAIVSSDDGQALDRCSRVRILATQPTEIQFTRAIRSAVALEAGAGKPIGDLPEAGGQSVLKIDSELLPYVTLVEFSKK
jgi:hypothetical protein